MNAIFSVSAHRSNPLFERPQHFHKSAINKLEPISPDKPAVSMQTNPTGFERQIQYGADDKYSATNGGEGRGGRGEEGKIGSCVYYSNAAQGGRKKRLGRNGFTKSPPNGQISL